MFKRIFATLICGTLAATSQGSTLLEDFESFSLGPVEGQGGCFRQLLPGPKRTLMPTA